jgi:hypothetical protein
VDARNKSGHDGFGTLQFGPFKRGWQAACKSKFRFSRKRLRNCAAPFLNSPVERTNRVHDRLPPDARSSTVALAARGFRRCYFVISRCYFAVSAAMKSMKKTRQNNGVR